jgi:ribulose-5-phosphate 4-epimerase/fuculose-1-phosphate aldolase
MSESDVDSDENRIADLIEANHILANESVLDGFGHVSVRSLTNPRHFYMACSRAPALVSRDDIMEFDERSQPVDQRGRKMYGERFIHGEIMAVRSDVNAVVHSHSPEVLPFSVTKAPFKALIHVAAFLGTTPAPVFEIRDAVGEDNGMLVNENRSGAALAKVLGDRPVVLMRGHGMSVVAENVKLVVLRAIYTQLNARIEAAALRLGEPNFLNAYEVLRTDPIDRPWEVWAADARSARQ